MKQKIKYSIGLCFCLFLGHYTAHAQGYTEVDSFVKASAGVGYDVAIYDNILVVGLPEDSYDSLGQNYLVDAGAVLIYAFDSINGFVQKQKLNAKFRKAGANFGNSVAIDNSVLVVGSFHDDTTGSQLGGSFYIFEKNANVWEQTHHFRASDWQESRDFAYSVAVNNDVIMVGDPEHNNGWIPYNHRGKVYIYERNTTGKFTEVDQLSFPYLSAGTKRRFGNSISIYNNKVIIGAPLDETPGTYIKYGAAYAFERINGVWTQKDRLHGWNNNQSYANFGWSVDMHLNTLIIGATDDLNQGAPGAPIPHSGAVYIYDFVNGSWTQKQKIRASDYLYGYEPRFGTDVSIHGNELLVLSNDDQTSTANANAYFFKKSGNTWNEVSKHTVKTNFSFPSSSPKCAISSPLAMVGTEQTHRVKFYFKCKAMVYNQSVNLCPGEGILLEGMIQTTAGIYTDSLKSKFNCDSIVITDLTFDNVNLNLKLEYKAGQSISVADSSSTYQWLECPDMTPINGETNQSFFPKSNGNYAVLVTKGLCIDTSDCIEVNTIGIVKESEKNFATLYPNPTSGNFTIKFNKVETGKLKISQLSGQVIEEFPFNSENELNIDLSTTISSGTYLIKIETQDSVFLERLMILRK